MRFRPVPRLLVQAMLGAAVVLQASATAQQPAAPATFRFERPIAANGQGPRRLAVDVPLLAGANRELSDLRLFDANAREIPYLLVSKPLAEPAWRPAVILPVASVDADKKKESGFEADLGEIRTADRLRIDGLPPPFLKRLRLEGSGDRARWTLLVAEGTLFDLPDEKLRQTELAFAAGAYRYFRLTWDDTNSGRLPPPASAAARLVTSVVPPPPLTASLAVERRPSEPGRSRYRIRLPGGHLPIAALELDLDAAGAGIESIFGQLLDHRGGPLDHFSSGDLIGELRRQHANARRHRSRLPQSGCEPVSQLSHASSS